MTHHLIFSRYPTWNPYSYPPSCNEVTHDKTQKWPTTQNKSDPRLAVKVTHDIQMKLPAISLDGVGAARLDDM